MSSNLTSAAWHIGLVAPAARRWLRVAWAACLLGLVVTFWPTALGGATSYVIVSGHSMLPTLHQGDLVFLRTQDHYTVSDVVAFHPPSLDVAQETVVIHRLVAGDEQSGFTARGDNNDHDDPWGVRHPQVLGELWLTVPKVGLLLSWAISPLGLGLLAAAVGAHLTLTLGSRTDQTDESGDERNG